MFKAKSLNNNFDLRIIYYLCKFIYNDKNKIIIVIFLIVIT